VYEYKLYDEHLQHGDSAPCVQIRRLVSGFERSNRERRLMIPLVAPQLVVDESGYGQKGLTEAFVFAGFIGDVHQWEDFTHYWAPIMSEDRPWTADRLKRNRGKKDHPRILRLIEAIGKSGIARIQFRIPDSDYQIAVKGNLQSWFRNKEIDEEGFKRLDNPYLFAFYSNLLSVLGAIREHEGVELDVIYDYNIEHRERLEDAYQGFLESDIPAEVKAMLPKVPIPRNDKTFMPLQAADLLAWHTHKDFVETKEGNIHADAVWLALKDLPKVVDDTWYANDLRLAIRGLR
jgi:hypothetical protein